jgi:hypothetical protein
MTDENQEESQDLETEEDLPTPSESTGDELGLAEDFYKDYEYDETSETETGSGEELSQESDESVETEATPEEEAQGQEDAEKGEQPADETPATQKETPQQEVQEGTFLEYEDHKFKDAGEVSQYLRTVEGRQRVAQVAHRDALHKNQAWIDFGNDPAKLRNRLAELEGVEPDKVSAAPAEKPTALRTLDWQNLEKLVSEGKGMQALATMADNYDKVLEQRLAEVEARVTESSAPMVEREAARKATVDLMTTAENHVTEAGDFMWPEFNRQSPGFDPQFCALFSQVWEQLPAKLAWDENLIGIEVAYDKTKQLYERMKSEEPAAPAAATPAPTEALPPGHTVDAAGKVHDAQGKFVKQTEAELRHPLLANRASPIRKPLC